MAALGCSGERGGDGFGGERERRRSRGECGGEWGGETEGARRGDLIPSSRRRRGGVRLGRALFRPGSGEQGKGTRCGSWAGWAGQAGCGPGGLGGGRAGGLGCLVQGASPLFCFFVISFFYLFSLSVLFSFRAFRHFIKWCLLHHNYQCNIWQPPNIFALPFENLGCLSLIHILNLQ